MGKFFKQIRSTLTDKDWDADGAKIAGGALVILGIIILIVCLIKWDFAAAAQIGIALVGFGSGLLGWRAATDKSIGQ